MSTTVMDEVVSQMCLCTRVIEAAVHRPNEWVLRCDAEKMAVHVTTICVNDGSVEAHFTVGPMPGGTHYLTLECDEIPLFSGEFTFTNGQWWTYRVCGTTNR